MAPGAGNFTRGSSSELLTAAGARCSGEFTSPNGGARPPLLQTGPPPPHSVAQQMGFRTGTFWTLGQALPARRPRALRLVGVGLFCSSLALAQLPAESEDAQAHANQGVHLLQTGDLAGAEGELREAVQRAPRNPAFLGTLGAILGMEHKLAESNVFLEKALTIDPLSTQTRRNLASNQFQLGDLIPARKNLRLLLKNDPADKPSIL